MNKTPAVYVYNYSYDEKGYMIKKEEVALNTSNNFPVTSSRHIYKRDEHGYE